MHFRNGEIIREEHLSSVMTTMVAKKGQRSASVEGGANRSRTVLDGWVGSLFIRSFCFVKNLRLSVSVSPPHTHTPFCVDQNLVSPRMTVVSSGAWHHGALPILSFCRFLFCFFLIRL